VGPGSGGPRGRTAEVVAGARELLHAKRILIHEGDRRVKTREAVRDLPIPPVLERPGGALGARGARACGSGLPGTVPGLRPHSAQLAGSLRRGQADRRDAARCAAHLRCARAQAGIPIVRLQKLPGHATPIMTMRYMKHAPEAYLDQDAAAIASHLTGASDPEAAARVDVARREIKPA
jgi:hypothetical protein